MCAFFTLYEESLLQAEQLCWQIEVPFRVCHSKNARHFSHEAVTGNARIDITYLVSASAIG